MMTTALIRMVVSYDNNDDNDDDYNNYDDGDDDNYGNAHNDSDECHEYIMIKYGRKDLFWLVR